MHTETKTRCILLNANKKFKQSKRYPYNKTAPAPAKPATAKPAKVKTLPFELNCDKDPIAPLPDAEVAVERDEELELDEVVANRELALLAPPTAPELALDTILLPPVAMAIMREYLCQFR